MQTFIPEPDYAECARVLDNKRLVKQLLEGRQILSAIHGETKGWVNHPATKMWTGYSPDLYDYLVCIAKEMRNRGYKYEKNWSEIKRMFNSYFAYEKYHVPSWKHEESEFLRVMTTHRGNLYIKAPDLYPQYEADAQAFREYVCCENCNYYWPAHMKEI